MEPNWNSHSLVVNFRTVNSPNGYICIIIASLASLEAGLQVNTQHSCAYSLWLVAMKAPLSLAQCSSAAVRAVYAAKQLAIVNCCVNLPLVSLGSFWPQHCASIAQVARIYIRHRTTCKDLHMQYNYGCIHTREAIQLHYYHSKVSASPISFQSTQCPPFFSHTCKLLACLTYIIARTVLYLIYVHKVIWNNIQLCIYNIPLRIFLFYYMHTQIYIQQYSSLIHELACVQLQ